MPIVRFQRHGVGFALVVLGAAVATALVGTFAYGPVGSAIGAVVGLVAPLAIDWISRRVDAHHAFGELGHDDIVDGRSPERVGPGELLLPGRPWAIHFVDRSELRELQEWCSTRGTIPIRLVTGAGGVGKTRVCLQLLRVMEEQGWLCRRVREGEVQADAVRIAERLAGRSRSVLLMIDYAETCSALPRILDDLARTRADIRLVLIARSAGAWWDSLRQRSSWRGRLDQYGVVVRIHAHVWSRREDVAHFANRAAEHFAAITRRPVPKPLTTNDLSQDASLLTIQMAAVAAVLGGSGQSVPSERTDVIARLLGHEATYWRRSAERAQLPPVQDEVLARIVALCCLLTFTDEAAVAEQLRRVPDLFDASHRERRAIARWLRELYPGTDASWLGKPGPDIVSEHHAVQVLAGASEFRDAVFDSLAPAEAAGALTVLSRAAAHHVDASKVLAILLRRNPQRLMPIAVVVARHTPGPLMPELVQIIDDTSTIMALPVLEELARLIPYPSYDFRDLLLSVTQRIVNALPDSTPAVDYANWQIQLGVALNQMNRLHEAIAATDTALNWYREAAGSDSHSFDAEQALALSNLSAMFPFERRPEALEAATAAVEIYRRLYDIAPKLHEPSLATALNNFGVLLTRLDRPNEARAAMTEAISIRRRLADHEPRAFRQVLALTLNNLSEILDRTGEHELAAEALEEAIELYRGATHDDPLVADPEKERLMSLALRMFRDPDRLARAFGPRRTGKWSVRQFMSVIPSPPPEVPQRPSQTTIRVGDRITSDDDW